MSGGDSLQQLHGVTPLRVMGSKISYYTGKFEGYLRYKEIPYEFVTMTPRVRREVTRRTGAAQMPAVELADGRWMTDSTPMIAWLEEQFPTPAVIPIDPLQRFFSLLVEDYAEEWLWRPAMHFRWSYRRDALQLSRTIADEIVDVPLPGPVRRAFVRRRQIGGWTRGDGVTADTWAHVEGCYTGALERLTTILADRPFLLGARPTIADFGFFASMFRHFGQDPTPAHLMRETAPLVFEWQARVWAARASTTDGPLVDGVPDDWGPILDDIGSAYLPYLNANARGLAAGAERHDADVQGVTYRDLPVSQYRVWCLERLREHVDAVPADVRDEVRTRLESHGCWAPLWEATEVASGYDGEAVPFRGEKVHYPGHRVYG
ncbi:MAG: glutathione S-transferase family protein [Actinomycetota bacterium]